MNFEFDEVVRDQADHVGAELSRIERHGGSVEEVEEAFGALDDVVGQLEAALAEARGLRADLDERAGEVREGIGVGDDDAEEYEDHGDGPLEGPLEELYENAGVAQDDGFSNMSAEDVL